MMAIVRIARDSLRGTEARDYSPAFAARLQQKGSRSRRGLETPRNDMRQIGNLSTEQDARRFADYLLTQGVESKALKESDGQWAIWVRDENKLDQAREHYTHFQSNP